MLRKNNSELNNYHDAIQHEWLETNGLGGWASSSIIGCNTRRYHGLLIAATNPPADRMALVSKLDETIVINDEKFELGTNDYGGVTHPKGYGYLSSFTKDLFPEWEYEAGGVILKKTMAMVHDENSTLILYEVLKSPQPFALKLQPLVSARGYHSLQHSHNNIFWNAYFENGIFQTLPFDGAPQIFISVPGATYDHHPSWFYNFNYAVEKYRGLDFTDDLFNHGTLSVELNQGDKIGVIISTENLAGRNAMELFLNEKERKQSLISGVADETLQQLILAADQFIVKRDENLKTIIAGYHWFTDWGRDTMISLPGLCLSTGRYEDAKKILSAFSKSVSMGMLPNRFQDNGEAPEYNNVDGTLWYFVAVYKYLQYTNDIEFVLSEILPVLKNIIDWHYKGTRYNIHVMDDGLLYAGEPGQQLTWMDARIGSWVVTPRMGKPVEIQALWYNALKIFAELLKLNDQQNDAFVVNANADKAKQSFNEQFWYEQGNYLYDVLDENGTPNKELRPNLLFSISLPFALIEGNKARSVIKIVEEELYTPVGLKSLSKNDLHYVPVYGGDAWHRDSSYHQGTVWSWLLGAYVDALVKVDVERSKIEKVIHNFLYHLNEGCIGSVSEIFDAEPPHHPRGCIAQAWGVAEILRVIKDYEIFEKDSHQIMELAQA
jgi:predicted glycogen debranching enzyme